MGQKIHPSCNLFKQRKCVNCVWHKVRDPQNGKDAVKYKVLKIWPIRIVSHIAVIEFSSGISMIFYEYSLLKVNEC